MKNIIIIFSLILPNLLFADILEKFPLACICDKNINALKYFDCKQKVSGTQLDIIKNQNSDNIFIFSSFDEKKYQLVEKELVNLVFSISYKGYNKKWSYDLKCVSLKKE